MIEENNNETSNKEVENEKNTNSAVQVLDTPPEKKPEKVQEKKAETPQKEIKENKENKLPVKQNIKQEIQLGKANDTPSKHKLGIFSIFGILLTIFIILLIIGFLIFSFTMKSNTNIFNGIYIKGIDVSNLSKEDAKNKLNKYIETSIPEEIILSHGDFDVALNTAEININYDIDSAVNTAFNIGRDSNIIFDGINIISTSISNKNVDPSFTIDEEALNKLLEDVSSKLPDKVIESGYYIEDNNLIINKGSEGKIININKTKQKIKNEIKNLNLINNKIEAYTEDASPKKVELDAVYNEVRKDATNAEFTANPLSVTPSENGIDFAISLEEAKSKLEEDNKECVIPLKVVYPSITTNMIGTEAFPDKLSEFSTKYAASNVNRTTNLRLAANKINGTVLMPGEVFSYNQVVGARTIAAGYKEAPIYVSGRVEDGLGGGICQITTTLYNAVAYANLEIVERTNHQFVPSYVGAGRDATVVYGAIDFKFKNNRNYPIKIICSVSSGIANFQILGLKTAEDYNVEIYSRITSQSAGYTKSETYKILKKNGAVVDQVLLSRDTYKRH